MYLINNHFSSINEIKFKNEFIKLLYKQNIFEFIFAQNYFRFESA